MFFPKYLCFCAALVVPLYATETLDFELKPAGIEQTVKQTGYGVTCIFTYFAEGGTKEHWTLSVKRSKDHKDVLCVAERPDVQSYLMFESFSMNVENAHINSVKVYSDHGTRTPDEVFTIDEAKTTVSSTESFKNEMTVLRVRATILKHNEL